MEDHPLKTPVVLLIFNRPEAAARVFETIRRARPALLLIVADGPRSDRTEDADLCRLAREAVVEPDWPCETRTLFSDHNLGCRLNVSQGLDWVFDQVDQAIILEDDCLPDQSFFRFCEELLLRYRDNPKVSQICGSNYQQGIRRTSDSYYFSRHAHIWGWATWRRSWEQKDIEMTQWPALRRTKWLEKYIGNSKAAFYWRKLFDDSSSGKPGSLNSWAIPWTFSCWKNCSVSVIPNVNLIANIGYSDAGTHTSGDATANLSPVKSMDFPLCHPEEIKSHVVADNFTEETFYYGSTLAERLFWSLRIPFSVAFVRKVRMYFRQFYRT